MTPLAVVAAGVVIRFLAAEKANLGTIDISSIIVKSLPWTFFVGSLRTAMGSLVGNGNLVAKMAFPKEVFPLSAITARMIDFSVATAFAIVALVLLFDLRFTPVALYAIPLFMVVIVLVTGFGLLLSALNLLYRDVQYVVDVVLTFAIFFTPGAVRRRDARPVPDHRHAEPDGAAAGRFPRRGGAGQAARPVLDHLQHGLRARHLPFRLRGVQASRNRVRRASLRAPA